MKYLFAGIVGGVWALLMTAVLPQPGAFIASILGGLVVGLIVGAMS